MEMREPINWKDGVSALVLLAPSLFICLGSLDNLSYGSYHRPGPGFLPFWKGLLIGLMSLGLLFKSIWPGGEAGGGKLFQGSFRKPLYALLALVAYGLLFDLLGYFICNLLFMIFMILLRIREMSRRLRGIKAMHAQPNGRDGKGDV